MKIAELTAHLEKIAPPALQEDYDNSGLLVGDPSSEIEKALVCLDVTEDVVNEAVERGCGLIIAHHPLIFSGIKKFTKKNWVHRTLLKAIKNDVAIYAIHTNLDNIHNGVNKKICDVLGLENTSVLAPKQGGLKKLVTFCPDEDNVPHRVRMALFEAGAGEIGNYDQASFNFPGTGTFRPLAGANPHSGEVGKQQHEPEIRVEVIFPAYLQNKLVKALIEAHPYEEVAYDIIALSNINKETGSGMVGEFAGAMPCELFLQHLKNNMKTGCIRYTKPAGKTVKRVAVCGGSGSFLLENAVAAGADVFVTADFKYHAFFDADNRIMIADIGHFESEQFTIGLLIDLIQQKFPNFAVLKTEVNTNPVNYY